MKDARRVCAAAAVLLALAVLATPRARAMLEATMSLHMLVQFPLVAGAGAVLAGMLPPAWRRACERWNAHGITGLVAVALVAALLMIPRLLDLALVDTHVEVAKWLVLLVSGAALRLSWRPAGLLVQGFFLGNVLPMTAVVGQLFQDSPLRLCNAYLLDDQVRLGRVLVGVAIVVGIGWAVAVFWSMMRAEVAQLGADEEKGFSGPSSSPRASAERQRSSPHTPRRPA